jgi:hypothetical protein
VQRPLPILPAKRPFFDREVHSPDRKSSPEKLVIPKALMKENISRAIKLEKLRGKDHSFFWPLDKG